MRSSHLKSVRGGAARAQPASLEAFVSELHRAHAFWNARYWNGRLSTPEILFVPTPPNARRPCTFVRWTDPVGSTVRSRILLYPDRCLALSLDDTLLAFVRELVHQWEHEHADPPSRSDHHSIEWHAEAGRIGLQTSGRVGATESGPEFRKALREFEPRLVITLASPIERGKSKSLPWICACRPKPYRVRVARAGFSATCNICQRPFRPEHP